MKWHTTVSIESVLTAGVAAYFVKGSEEPEQGVTTADLMAKLEALEARINEMARERREG